MKDEFDIRTLNDFLGDNGYTGWRDRSSNRKNFQSFLIWFKTSKKNLKKEKNVRI